LVVDELGVLEGRARADVAVINGCLHAYEIKAARDTMSRLAAQQQAYTKVFDFITLVTTENHVAQVVDSVPNSWGVTLAHPLGSRVSLHEVRRPERNPHVESRALIQLLWRDEALAVLQRIGCADGVRSKPRNAIWSRLEGALGSVDEVGKVVRSVLKRRTDWVS
jgi:hypothetical protein